MAGGVLAGAAVWVALRPHDAKTPTGTSQSQAKVEAVAPAAGATPATGGTLRLKSDEVVASVNGHPVTAGQIMPMASTNGHDTVELSQETFDFYRQRAVDREVIFELAARQGIQLDNAQRQQLDNFKSMRHQPEPGGIAQLNRDKAGDDLELLDAKAFMLQTSLLAAQGASPDVTETQVENYYNQHAAEFGALPTDPAAREQAWSVIEVQIRHDLALTTRQAYGASVAAYMRQAEAQANVVMTPVSELAENSSNP